MGALVIYYSYTGKTKRLAETLAKDLQADVIELKEAQKRSTLSAYLLGSQAARKQEQAKLQDFNSDFSSYDKIIIAAPIWAGYPAPAMNNVIALLPEGKEIELILSSGSGKSKGSAEKTKALIEARGCKVVKYQDVKG